MLRSHRLFEAIQLRRFRKIYLSFSCWVTNLSPSRIRIVFCLGLLKIFPMNLKTSNVCLCGQTFHDKFPNTSRDSYPSFEDFPYKRLYVKKGTTPNTSVEEKMQQEVWRIDCSLKVVLNQVRTYIEHLSNTRIVR